MPGTWFQLLGLEMNVVFAVSYVCVWGLVDLNGYFVLQKLTYFLLLHADLSCFPYHLQVNFVDMKLLE